MTAQNTNLLVLDHFSLTSKVESISQAVPLILVVDDDLGNRQLLRRVMRQDGYRVAEAENGVEGLAVYEALKPDLVLMDALMPKMDGFTCCQQLTSRYQNLTTQVPNPAGLEFNRPLVLMITALEDSESVDRAFQAGAMDYITKPINRQVLRHRVRHLLHQATAMGTLVRQTQQERLMTRIQERMRQSLQLSSILETATVEVRQFLQADRVLIYRFDPDWSGVVEVEAVGDGWPPMLGQVIRDPCFTQNLVKYKTGEGFTIPDVGQAQLSLCHIALLQKFQVQANLVVPIVQSAGIWGLLIAHQCSGPRVWQSSEMALIQHLAAQLAIAIQQSELHNQIRQANQELEYQVRERTAQLQQSLNFAEVLNRITDRVRDSLEESQILQTAVQEIARALHVDYCGALIYDTDQSQATVKHDYHSIALTSTINQTVQVADALAVFQHLWGGDYFQFHETPQPESWGQQITVTYPTPQMGDLAVPTLTKAMHSRLLCPIFIDHSQFPTTPIEAIGYLAVLNQLYRPFSDMEVRLVQQVANQCAIAIRQARLYKTSQTQVEVLAELNRLKDEFLATITHELRTPMANIRLAIQMLEISLKLGQSVTNNTADPQAIDLETSLVSKIGHYLKVLRDECQRETRLINDLLEQSLNQQEPFLDIQAIALPTWLPKIVDPFRERCHQAQQTLALVVADNLPILFSDATKLECVVAELLENAHKYTPPHETITVQVTSPSDHQICLSVINSGVQIPSSEHQRIFEQFYRIRSADPWKQSGTGLGLALVKKRVQDLGGTIQVSSQPTLTCFQMTLPVQPGELGDIPIPQADLGNQV